METINLQIKDQQVIDLLWKFLRAGVVIDNRYQRTTTGIPQGGMISPILSNIYLHSLGMYLDKLKEELDTKQTSEPNPEYMSAKSKLRSKKEATKIREKIVIFLKEKLDLELSIEKTKITHASKEKVQFLGYEIYLPTPKEPFFAKGNVKKRASHVSIYMDAPYNKLKERLIDEKILVEKKW